MQTQNQHLLQQITERDDYNIKVITSFKARILMRINFIYGLLVFLHIKSMGVILSLSLSSFFPCNLQNSTV